MQKRIKRGDDEVLIDLTPSEVKVEAAKGNPIAIQEAKKIDRLERLDESTTFDELKQILREILNGD